MAVDVRIAGVLKPGAEGFSVVEDSTPIDPSDSTGGYGQITFNLPEEPESKFYIDKLVDLEDAAQGTTQGIARTISSTDGLVTVTADSRMALLAATKTAQPFVGTLLGAVEYYLGLVGITDHYLVEDSIASNPVAFIGWQSEVGFELKKVAISQGAELTLVSDNIVMRPVRGRIAQGYRDITRTWTIDSSEVALNVVVNYYESYSGSNLLAYPAGGWNEDVQIYTVDAGETMVIDLPLSSSLSAVQQPVVQDYVSSEYDSSSVYAVAGQDGLPYPAAQWTANGGRITVEINEDTQSLTVTIVGASDEANAPFGIKMSAGDSSFYSSLRIVGTGVFYEKKSVTIATGADPDLATQDIGATVDLKQIQSYEQALDLGVWAAARWAGPRHTLAVTTYGINRRGDTGSYAYPTLADFDALYVGDDVADFNGVWAGMTIGEFNDYMKALVSSDFANQAFGNIGGARVADLDAWFRIRSGTVSPSSVSYSAEMDTTVGDFNDAWGLVAEDVHYNRWAINPDSLASIAGWEAFGTAVSGPVNAFGVGVYAFSGTSPQAIGTLGIRQHYTVGDGANQLKPNTVYYFSIETRAYLTPLTFQATRLAASGTGVVSPGGTNYSASDWTRREISFTTAASGTVTLAVSNGAATTAGTTVVIAKYAMISETAAATYHDGDTDAYSFWLGLPDASVSGQIPASVETIADFNTMWADRSIREFNVRPLMRSA